MAALKYKVIKSKKQYHQYLKILEELVSGGATKASQDEMELLKVLIEKWNNDHDASEPNSFKDPVALVRSLMDQRNLRAKDLADILGVSKGLVSDILNHKKGLSKQNIRTLSTYFKVDISLRYTYKTW